MSSQAQGMALLCLQVEGDFLEEPIAPLRKQSIYPLKQMSDKQLEAGKPW